MPLYNIMVQDQALAAATAQTLWQIRTGSTRRVRIREFSLSFDGVNAANTPVKCELLRQTNNGTGSAYTILRWDQGDPAAISTAATSFSGEPTAGEIVFPFRLTPNGGIMLMQYAQDACPYIPVSSWLGLRCTAGATVNATTHVVFEE